MSLDPQTQEDVDQARVLARAIMDLLRSRTTPGLAALTVAMVLADLCAQSHQVLPVDPDVFEQTVGVARTMFESARAFYSRADAP